MQRFLNWLDAPFLPMEFLQQQQAEQTIASLNHDPAAYQRNLEAAGLTV